MLTPRPSDTAHCARLVTRSLVRFGRRPSTSGRRPFVLFRDLDLWGSRTRHTPLTSGDLRSPTVRHDRRRVATAAVSDPPAGARRGSLLGRPAGFQNSACARDLQRFAFPLIRHVLEGVVSSGPTRKLRPLAAARVRPQTPGHSPERIGVRRFVSRAVSRPGLAPADWSWLGGRVSVITTRSSGPAPWYRPHGQPFSVTVPFGFLPAVRAVTYLPVAADRWAMLLDWLGPGFSRTVVRGCRAAVALLT